MTGTAKSIARAFGVAGRDADRSLLLATLLVALSALAWSALWLWNTSPYGRYLDHGGWGDAGALAALCRAVPQGDLVVPAVLHAGSWVLMIAAMMLPTTFPVLALFRRIVAGRPDAGRLTALVVAGFFAAWFAFGLAAHALDALLYLVAPQFPTLVLYGWAIGAAVLAGAGLFQFSALKYRCLEQCHTPFAFVASCWHGSAPLREAWRLGVDHGVFCVGCCWALMLLMFVVGTGNLGWMLALAVVMAAEKNLPWGRRLRTPLGVGLLGWAGAIAIFHL
jgi:predicted metal-binding membrane protein